MHIGCRLQQVLGLFPARAREQRIGGDPVGTAAEDLATVDLEGKPAAGRILVGDQFDGAKTDLPCHHLVSGFDRQPVERLLAAAGRPPEPRFVDMEDVGNGGLAGHHAAIKPHPLAVQFEIELCHPLPAGKQGRRHQEIDGAVVVVHLARRHALDPRRLQPAQRYRAVKSERRDSDIPVPAEMALRLAQHVAVGDGRIAGMVGDVEGLLLLQGGADCNAGMQHDAERVFTGSQSLGNIGTIAAKAIVRLEHDGIVDRNGRHRIERVDIEIPVAVDLAENKAPLQNPVTMRHPLDDLLVAPDIGIDNDAGRLQCRMNVAGDLDFSLVVTARRCQLPCAGEIDRSFCIRHAVIS